MQGARRAAVRALQAVGNAAVRRQRPAKKSMLLLYESLGERSEFSRRIPVDG